VAAWKSNFRIAVLTFAALVLVAFLQLWHSHVKAERAQAIRDAGYGGYLSRFQKDLRLGMHRSEVYDYLRSHSVSFYDDHGYRIDAEVPIGQENADFTHFPCYGYEVFVVFRFNALPRQPTQSAVDNLSSIAIEKQCLK
jgi:hypothetical protein